jgi:hypothetical protein
MNSTDFILFDYRLSVAALAALLCMLLAPLISEVRYES